MHSSHPQDPVDGFTLELLRSGATLADLAGELIELMPPDAHPGEDSSEVVLGMISGTIRSFLSESDAAEVERATELIAGALDRVLEHLQLALELRRRMEGDAGGRRGDDGRSADLDDADADFATQLSMAAAREGEDEGDPFDALATELLDCGGVLSQTIAGMVAHEASRGGATEYVAIPEAARSLLREVLDELSDRHSADDAAIAARLVGEVTDALTNDVFLVNPDWN
jgi:hypothetical protein